LGAHLHLMRLLVVLLSRHLLLDLAQVQQLSRTLVHRWQLCLQTNSVCFKLLSVSFLERQNLVLIISLSLLQLVVPVLIKVLILLDVGLFALLSLLLVHEN
jgi:hypothetical protein